MDRNELQDLVNELKNVSSGVKAGINEANGTTKKLGDATNRLTQRVNTQIEALDARAEALNAQEERVSTSLAGIEALASKLAPAVDALAKADPLLTSIETAVNGLGEGITKAVDSTREAAEERSRLESEREKLETTKAGAEKALALLKLRNDLEVRREAEDAEFKAREKIVRDKLRAEEQARISYYDEIGESIENGLRNYYPEMAKNLDAIVAKSQAKASAEDRQEAEEYKSQVDVSQEPKAVEMIFGEKNPVVDSTMVQDVMDRAQEAGASSEDE